MKPQIRFNVLLSRERFLWEDAAYEDAWFAILLLTGSFEVTMRQRQDTVSPGDVVIFPRYEHFTRRCLAPITMIYIGFTLEGEEKGRSDFCGRLSFPDPARIHGDIAMLQALAAQPRLAQIEKAEHYFCDIWYEFRHMHSPHSFSDSLSDSVIAAAIRRIDNEYASPLKIAALAQELGMSHVHFTNRFRRATGMTPIEYLRRARLTAAERLLTSTELPMSEIAERCGFENQFYFSRSFGELYGLSPSDYRRSGRI